MTVLREPSTIAYFLPTQFENEFDISSNIDESVQQFVVNRSET